MVINVKWGIILGAAGLVLSLAIGLVSGAGFPLVFIRAGIFAAAFFALGCGIWFLISNFIPELLSAEKSRRGETEDYGESPGSRVNITLEDSGVLPEMYRHLHDENEVGNIGDLISGVFKPAETAVNASVGGGQDQGMDQMPEEGYTGKGSHGAEALGDLPDLGAMTGSFLNNTDEAGPAERPLPVRGFAGNKPQKLQGDFDPKELAAGIRTVLNKDE